MLSVIILSAGLGTRMKSDTPKVLHKICGKSMLSMVIDTALNISSDIHIVLYHKKDVIIDHIKSIYTNDILEKVTFVIQPHNKYPGTGGAIMQENGSFLNVAGDKVLILGADTPLIESENLLPLIQSDCDINIGIFKCDNPHGYGRIVFKENSIEQIVEEKDCSEEQRKINIVNGGIYCFKREVLQEYICKLDNNNKQKEYYLTQIISLSKNKKKSGHYIDRQNLVGVNSKIELAQAESIMLSRLRDRAMSNGVIMQIPDSIYIESSVSFEGECLLENGVRLIGSSTVQNSTIKAHSVIENSTVQNSTIKAHSVIENSTVQNSTIGPSAHIRPNSVINNTHIGNFVECKSAVLNGVKAGHLSYLGDCQIDSGSNIGAGVITCNYDGKAKHKTKIGKNVFVGSDCQLIAPVVIEDEVLIAAGSTITKDVPQGSIAISRQRQTNKEKGYYAFFDSKEK